MWASQSFGLLWHPLARFCVYGFEGRKIIVLTSDRESKAKERQRGGDGWIQACLCKQGMLESHTAGLVSDVKADLIVIVLLIVIVKVRFILIVLMIVIIRAVIDLQQKQGKPRKGLSLSRRRYAYTKDRLNKVPSFEKPSQT